MHASAQTTGQQIKAAPRQRRRGAFWPYFAFLARAVLRRFTNWLILGVYLLLLVLILVVVPVALDASPATYWNNPVVQVSAFVMPIAAVFASCVALDLFRGGRDSGVELIVVAKPVSRTLLACAKLLFLVLALAVFAAFSALCGLLSLAAPKMDAALVGDLAAGLFTGTFVNGLFFASLAVLLSLRLGKNGTNMVIILIALVLNFLTPLSALLFKTPAQILQDQGTYLVQQTWQKRDAGKDGTDPGAGGDVVFQARSSYGDTSYADVKQTYAAAEARTAYSASFYGNLGNMVNSLYNIGGLAPWANANIAYAPRNTEWQFTGAISPDAYTRVAAGWDLDALSGLGISADSLAAAAAPSASASVIDLIATRQYAFLPLPTAQDYGSLSALFSPPGWTYLVDDSSNATKKVSATAADYARTGAEGAKALGAALGAYADTLASKDASGAAYGDKIADALNALARADLTDKAAATAAVGGVLDAYAGLMNTTQMGIFRAAYQGATVAGDTYEVRAKSLFDALLDLFYGLDAVSRADAPAAAFPGSFLPFAQAVAAKLDASSPLFSDASEYRLLSAALRLADPMYAATSSAFGDLSTPAGRALDLAAYFCAFGLNAYSCVYLMNLLAQTGAETQTSKFTSSATLGIYHLRGEQLRYTYAVRAVPIVDWPVIVAVMCVLAGGFLAAAVLTYRWQDIR